MRSTSIFTLIFTIFISWSAFAQNRCQSLFNRESFNEIKTQVTQVLNSTELTSILLGTRKPNWQDYYNLINMIELIKKDSQGVKNKIAYINSSERIQLLRSVSETKRILDLQTQELNHILIDEVKREAYKRFLDYNIAYFELLKEINSLLRAPIFPIPDFSPLKSKKELISDAETLIKELENFTEETFQATGHKSLKDFEKYTEQFNAKMKRNLDIIKDHLVVSMHRPENGRFWIPIAGFQNQRVTGSSNGYYDADGGGRDRAEAFLLRKEVADYIPLSARFKPNYAEARPDKSIKDIKPSESAGHYGSDLWIIKKSVIEKRATWTPQDSLGPAWYTTIKKNSFDDIFIPWKYKAFMAPYATSPNSFSPAAVENNFKLDGRSRWQYGSGYFEVQIFGPLGIDDVQAFHFMKNPPDKKLYDLLVSKGIEVMDERTWPAKKYDGSESK